MTVRRRLAVPAILLTLLSACGVPADDAPRAVTTPRGANLATPTPAGASAQPGRVAERLYYVRDDKLVPVIRRLRTEPTARAHLDLLLSGPTDDEQNTGLSTAANTPNTVIGLQVTDGRAQVDIGDAIAGTGRNDEILAFGQIVCTLTSRTDVDRVTFSHDGEELGIPRADGSLSRSPLTADDYTDLISTD